MYVFIAAVTGCTIPAQNQVDKNLSMGQGGAHEVLTEELLAIDGC